MKLHDIYQRIGRELEFAESNFAPFNSYHEGYAVLLEEVDELWTAIKSKVNTRDNDVRGEAIQVATMAVRFLRDVCY